MKKINILYSALLAILLSSVNNNVLATGMSFPEFECVHQGIFVKKDGGILKVTDTYGPRVHEISECPPFAKEGSTRVHPWIASMEVDFVEQPSFPSPAHIKKDNINSHECRFGLKSQ